MDKIKYVNGFLFSPDYKKITLLRKNRPEWQAGKINGIGGRIELEETPIEAMVREFDEEAGLTINDWRHFLTLEGDTWIVYMFTATSKDYNLAFSKTDEMVEIHYVFDVPSLDVISNLKWLIPMATDIDNINGHIYYL